VSAIWGGFTFGRALFGKSDRNFIVVSHLLPEILIFVYGWMNDTLWNTAHTRIHIWCFVRWLFLHCCIAAYTFFQHVYRVAIQQKWTICGTWSA